MPLTPDQPTKRYYQEHGYRITKVEAWGLYPEIHRTDFLGIYDFIAFDDEETIAVQTTTKSNHSARKKKMLRSHAFSWWTKPKAKRRSVLLTWYKESGRWESKEEELTIEEWEHFQKEEKEKNSQIDTNSPLYKELFGDEAECVPLEKKQG